MGIAHSTWPRNQASSTYEHISVRRVSGSIGAEISGVDLDQPLDAATGAEILDAFTRNLVIYFRGQRMSPERHVAFSAMFGPHTPIPHLIGREDHAEIQFIRKDAADATDFVVGERWHSDSTYLASPPGGVVARGALIPEVGGDTMFTNMYAVFETLSPAMQAMLRGLRAIHSGDKVVGSQRQVQFQHVRELDAAQGNRESSHPVVMRHARSGRELLYVNPVYTRRFDGMTEEESAGLLATLYEHTAKPQFQCRIGWEPDQVLVWDNLASQHRAIFDYAGQARCLERTTFGGLF